MRVLPPKMHVLPPKMRVLPPKMRVLPPNLRVLPTEVLIRNLSVPTIRHICTFLRAVLRVSLARGTVPGIVTSQCLLISY